MKRWGDTLQMLVRSSTVFVLCVVFPVVTFSNEHGDRSESVHFRDLHRSGSVKIIGHFSLPIGQTLTLKGVRAKPSKVSNSSTLLVRSVNDVQIPEDSSEGWPPLIQIANIYELPKRSTITLEGYEFAVWRGTAEKNWHIDVEFMVTKVVEPNTLELYNCTSLTQSKSMSVQLMSASESKMSYNKSLQSD